MALVELAPLCGEDPCLRLHRQLAVHYCRVRQDRQGTAVREGRPQMLPSPAMIRPDEDTSRRKDGSRHLPRPQVLKPNRRESGSHL